MIFATVGTQLPFPRMVAALDRLAQIHALPIFIQTADPESRPLHAQAASFLKPDEFNLRVCEARVLVGHAGIGTIITAKRVGKPLILYPRRAQLGEHRDDHQLDTAKAFANELGIHVALDDAALEDLLTRSDLAAAAPLDPAKRESLITRIRGFIEGRA